MNPKDFKSRKTGRVIRTTGGYFAFVPAPLPVPLKFDAKLVLALSRADTALSELAGVGRLLPNPHLFIAPLMRQEAVLSSRIEGTRATLSDLLESEALQMTPAAGSDVLEVRNYVAAMEYGLARLSKLPLSLRLVCELHGRLMHNVRGHHATRGEFRRSQNWIGPQGSSPETAPYVPPPVDELMPALGNWEKYLHERDQIPDLVQCAIMHEQFEAIHPFLDGNGRVGRLLITLFLVERQRLPQPLLYLSAFIEAHRQEYYDLLQRVRTRGEWTAWIRWFLRGVEVTARDAASRAGHLAEMRERSRARLVHKPNAARLLDELFANPFLSVRRASEALSCTAPTAIKAIRELEANGVIAEVTGRQRGRVYIARDILNVLQAPLSA
jgi:Fic family protein